MTVQPAPRYAPDEYLALERISEMKNEYLDGEIFAMTGASETHNLMTLNIAGELRQQMKGRPCKVYSNDMRVRVNATGLYTYPDVIALCEEARFEDEFMDTLINPTVIFEVLSRSTEAYDRGDKFAHYRKVESLKEYLLVSQNKCFIEHYIRQPGAHWLLSEIEGVEGTVGLPSITCKLALAEVYDKVDGLA